MRETLLRVGRGLGRYLKQASGEMALPDTQF